MRKIVTCWYRVNDDEVEFNHISDGFDPSIMTPPAHNPEQKAAWKSQKWEARRGTLLEAVIQEDGMEVLPVSWSGESEWGTLMLRLVKDMENIGTETVALNQARDFLRRVGLLPKPSDNTSNN